VLAAIASTPWIPRGHETPWAQELLNGLKALHMSPMSAG
jgi:hypothetical protein